MDNELIVNKYISLCQMYHVDIEVVFVYGDKAKQEIIGDKIILNIDKISKDEFEMYLSYNVRKLLLPRLVLETDRLILRRFDYNDSNDCFEFLSDKETCYNDGGYEPFMKIDNEYKLLMDKFDSQKTRYMIVLKDGNKVIGTINLFDPKDRVVETFEIGYVISPNYRRKGYAFEAINAFSNLLLKALHLDMLVAGAIESNIPSLKMIKKLGFVYEGKKTKSFYHPTYGPIDLLYYVKER
jgi:RimJ/RimL family protein N-acetyltransferase